MSDLIIKYLFLYSNCIYSYHKLLPSCTLSRKKIISGIFSVFILTLITILCRIYTPSLMLSLPLVTYWLLLCIFQRNPKLAFVTCTVSFTLCYGALGVSCFIVIPLLKLLRHSLSAYATESIICISGIMQTILVILIFRIKRLKNGMPYLYNTNVINLGILLGIIVISSITFIQTHPTMSLIGKSVSILIISFSLIGILHWWRSQLTKAYRKRLAQLELESLRTELDQKTALLKKIEVQNEEMGRLIHKDNKLIPAMEHAVSMYLASDFTDMDTQIAQGQALLSDLKEFSEARRGILSTFTPVSAPKYNTGIPSLDAILVYMYQKAQSQGIRFYSAVTPESMEILPTSLSAEKLVHLLSDLLENAIIATKVSTNKEIQLQIYVANGIFTIEVADTGCPFEPTTLISFGIEKASTHLNEGGGGIGLLDIWKIKEETRASIHIHEYEQSSPFSKKLFLAFDKKNKYVIHTWRDKELTPLVNRGDIVILPHE